MSLQHQRKGHMATIYMKIDGIDGNVTAKGYEKWIEILGIEYGLGRSITSFEAGRHSNRGVNAPSFSEIRISKEVDETSPKLFMEACLGIGKKINIHFCESGDNLQSYLELELTDAMLSSYSLSGASGSNSGPKERFSLNFAKIQNRYKPYTKDGKPGTPISTGYDLSTAEKAG